MDGSEECGKSLALEKKKKKKRKKEKRKSKVSVRSCAFSCFLQGCDRFTICQYALIYTKKGSYLTANSAYAGMFCLCLCLRGCQRLSYTWFKIYIKAVPQGSQASLRTLWGGGQKKLFLHSSTSLCGFIIPINPQRRHPANRAQGTTKLLTYGSDFLSRGPV